MTRHPPFYVRLLKIADPALQSHRLSAWLQDESEEHCLAMLDECLLRALDGDEEARRFLNPWLLTSVLLNGISAERRRILSEKSFEMGLALVRALFTDLSPVSLAPPVQAFRIQDARPSAGHEGGRDPITLGERRALAKTRDIKVLEKMLIDPDLQVVQNLLDNPHLQERHVLKIASRRPVLSEVLQHIACHRRWGHNPRVRQTLALNPYTPPLLSVLSLLTAALPQVDEVSQDGNLHPFVRQIAQEILRRRS